MRRTSGWWPLGTMLLVMSLDACGRSEPYRVSRLLDTEPEVLFALADLTSRETVFDWPFAGGGDLDPWQASGLGADPLFDDSCAVLAHADGPLHLQRRVDWQAAGLHEIEVDLGTPPRAPPRIFWAAAAERFGGDRQTTGELGASGRDGSTTYRFRLAPHALWRGRIGRVQLKLPGDSGSEVRVCRIRGLRNRLALPDQGASGALPRKVELGGELRNGLIVPGDSPVEWSLEVARHSQLRFAFGLLPGALVGDPPSDPAAAIPSTRSFRVSLEPVAGDRVILFEQRLDVDDSVGWREARVDLTDFGARRGTLVFEVAGPSTACAAGLPVWANPTVSPIRPRQRPPDVILISIDTLRGDRLSLNGYPRETTPEIDRWARPVGVNFVNAIAAASWTLPSHVSMLTGLEATRHGVNYDGPAPASLDTLAEILRARGYRTVAITGGGWMHPALGFAQGFERYISTEATSDELEGNLSRALEVLAGADEEPLFLFFHTYAVHFPYRPREPYLSRLSGRKPGEVDFAVRMQSLGPDPDDLSPRRRWVLHRGGQQDLPREAPRRELLDDLYDSGVAYADALLSGLLDRIGERQRATLTILTSDHGSALEEHGQRGHGYLYDDNLRVPLIFAFPGRIEGGRQIRDQVSSVDILPTILELLDIEPPTLLDGRSLVPHLEGRGARDRPTAWTYVGRTHEGLSLRVANRYKYILRNSPWRFPAPTEEVFDLSRDPGETENLLLSDSFDAAPFRQLALGQLDLRPGLRLQLDNLGARPFSGSVTAPRLRPQTIKSADLGCDCVSWSRGRGGNSVRFTVPPGQSYNLEIEEPPSVDLVLRLEWPPAPGERRPATREVRDLSTLEEPLVLFFDGSGWRSPHAGDQTPEVGIRVTRKGPAGGMPESPTETDESLRRELRALGYLQ